MPRRALFTIGLVLGILVILPAPTRAGICTASLDCPSTCSLQLTCPDNGCPISCVNHPYPASVGCTGSSSCSVTADSIFCDGNQYICPPFECIQGSDWIQCSNNEIIHCPGPGEFCT